MSLGVTLIALLVSLMNLMVIEVRWYSILWVHVLYVFMGCSLFFSFFFFGGENSISGSISIWSMLVSICNQFGPSLTEVDYKLTVSWKQQWPNLLLTKCEVQINTDPKCMDQNSIQIFFAVLFEHVRWNMNSHLVYSEIL